MVVYPEQSRMEHHKHKSGEPLDYHYIDGGIYQGTNQCCMSGLAEVLEKEGISSDISLEDIRLDQPFGVDMYIWIPIADTTPPTPQQLDFGVSSLEKMVAQGRKIYVHCKNGHGRATTLTAAYFIKTKNMGAKEAFEYVKKHRPSVHLTDEQMQALETYAASQK